MIKIIEEALENIIRRLDLQDAKLEELEKSLRPTLKPISQNGELASPGQLKYLKALGGTIWAGMTKKQASIRIDDLVQKKKKSDNNKHIDDVQIDDMVEETNTIEELMEETLL